MVCQRSLPGRILLLGHAFFIFEQVIHKCKMLSYLALAIPIYLLLYPVNISANHIVFAIDFVFMYH